MFHAFLEGNSKSLFASTITCAQYHRLGNMDTAYVDTDSKVAKHAVFETKGSLLQLCIFLLCTLAGKQPYRESNQKGSNKTHVL